MPTTPPTTPPKAPELTAKEPPQHLVDSMPPLTLGPNAFFSAPVATNTASQTVRQSAQEPAAAPTTVAASTKGLHR